ncbi:MAG: phosphate propanoyltransferase [Acidaminococcaceae bacterium]
MKFPLILGVSARHLHLTRQDMDTLFGVNSELHTKKPIGQPGQFAADEQITLITAKSKMTLRVIGPLRSYTQVELSLTDARSLGLTPPIRNSGDIENSAGATIVGPKGEVILKQGIIVAARHIHLNPETANKYALHDGDIVDIVTPGERSLTLHNVLVRAGATHADECHLDTDEANACGLASDAMIEIVTK